MGAYVDDEHGPVERYHAYLIATDPDAGEERAVARNEARESGLGSGSARNAALVHSRKREGHPGGLAPIGGATPVRGERGPMVASEATPGPVAERVDAHFAAARRAVRRAGCDYQGKAAKVAVAHDGERGVWQA